MSYIYIYIKNLAGQVLERGPILRMYIETIRKLSSRNKNSFYVCLDYEL